MDYIMGSIQLSFSMILLRLYCQCPCQKKALQANLCRYTVTAIKSSGAGQALIS